MVTTIKQFFCGLLHRHRWESYLHRHIWESYVDIMELSPRRFELKYDKCNRCGYIKDANINIEMEYKNEKEKPFRKANNRRPVGDISNQTKRNTKQNTKNTRNKK